MINCGMVVALGTDFNPNAHCLSMPMVMHLACVNLKMTLNEVRPKVADKLLKTSSFLKKGDWMQTLFFCCSFLESFYALCISLYLALYQALCTKCTKCTSFVSGTSCGDDQRSSQHWSRRLPWQFTGRPWHKIAFSEWSMVVIGPKYTWGPIYGTGCLYVYWWPCWDWCDSDWWRYQLNKNW